MVHLQGPFKNAYLTPQMQQFNKSMSEVRISVEWLFNDIINYFKFMDFKKNLKVGLSSVGKMTLYQVSFAMLSHACMAKAYQSFLIFSLQASTITLPKHDNIFNQTDSCNVKYGLIKNL